MEIPNIIGTFLTSSTTNNIIRASFVVCATIGWLIARWIIKQYDNAPAYSFHDYQSQSQTSNANDAVNQKSTNPRERKARVSTIHTRLPSYQGPNPFTIKKLSRYERFKIYLFCITGIALLRFIVVILLVLSCYIICVVVTPCASKDGFISHWLTKLIRLYCGFLLFVFGFYFIDFTDSRPPIQRNDSKPFRVIVGNHCTLFDGFILMWRTSGVIAAKKELSKNPMIGTIGTALGTFWIDRNAKKGRDFAKNQIINHVKDYKAPPLIIFPQGTTSNVHTVTSFKTGAFAAKEKVLEVSLNWSRNKHCDVSHVSNVNVIARALHIGCCQFINYCHVDICGAHTPDEAECGDLNLFAENSRKTIVSSLNRIAKQYGMTQYGPTPITATDHSFSDWILLSKAMGKNESFDTSNILMGDIISNLKLRTRTVTKLAEEFARFDRNGSGFIEFEEFCEAFNRDPNEESQRMKDLFNVFNTREGQLERIGFDEFLCGVATCFVDEMYRDAVKIMCNATKEENGARGGERYVVKDNILESYQYGVEESHFGNKEEYNKWMDAVNGMRQFVQKIFEERDKMTFEEFSGCVDAQGQQHCVQEYLQGIILIRLRIKLSNEDFR